MRIASGHRTYVTTVVLVLTLICTATARYSGGAGTAEDPYRIATAADLILLGESPEDYDKHFVLTADIDLDPNLPGGRVFDRAVIAPDPDPMDPNLRGALFAGVLDGNGHTLSHLTVHGAGYIGLFGQLASGAQVRGLAVVRADVTGAYYTGGVVGHNRGAAVACHVTGSVRGTSGPYTGGLVGSNDGHLLCCYSTGAVTGTQTAGGLVGKNYQGTLTGCLSNGAVISSRYAGGLVGLNEGTVTACCSTGTVFADSFAGGLAAVNTGTITNSYATGQVTGTDTVGGLVGANVQDPCDAGTISNCYAAGAVWGHSRLGGLVGANVCEATLEEGEVTHCFWDIWASGQAGSSGGTGRTTPEMQTAATFLDAGWDFIGETANGTEDIWRILEGQDYPRLWWEAQN